MFENIFIKFQQFFFFCKKHHNYESSVVYQTARGLVRIADLAKCVQALPIKAML